jgi:hypothetical protein
MPLCEWGRPFFEFTLPIGTRWQAPLVIGFVAQNSILANLRSAKNAFPSPLPHDQTTARLATRNPVHQPCRFIFAPQLPVTKHLRDRHPCNAVRPPLRQPLSSNRIGGCVTPASSVQKLGSRPSHQPIKPGSDLCKLNISSAADRVVLTSQFRLRHWVRFFKKPTRWP